MPLEIEEHTDERSMPFTIPMSKYWAMDDGYFFTSLDTILSMSVTSASAMAESGRIRMEEDAREVSSGRRKLYTSQDGIARIDMIGPMTKRPNCMAEMFGGGGVSTIRTRQALRAAVNDDAIKSIMMVIESPGGEVSGAFDLAADVARANKIKPVVAYIEDLGASAAYLVASQAGKINANSNAISGSIGVYQELHDTSKLAAFKGVKVHVIKAGEHKAIGVPGTEITEEQLAVVQANANKLHGLFLRAVSRGRSMDAKALVRVADGSIFIGADGKRAGLIDNISTIDETHNELANTKFKRNTKGKSTMPQGMVGVEVEEVQRMLDIADADEMLALDDDKVVLQTTETPETTVVQAPPVQTETATTTSASVEGLGKARIGSIDEILVTAGITNANQLNTIIEMSKVGEDYTAALRKQVTQLAIVAFGQTDGPVMSVGVDTANVAQLRAMNRQFAGIAEQKGLIAKDGARGERQTLPQEIAGGIGGGEQASGQSNEGQVTVPKEKSVADNRSNMNGTGLYSL